MSNTCPDRRGQRWSLIQAYLFSCAVGREEHCKQISLVCVGSACSVWVSLGLPPLTTCVLSQSTLLRLQVAFQGKRLKWALSLVYFSGLSHSGSGSWVLHKGRLSWNCFVPFSDLNSSGNQVLGERTLPRFPATQFPGCAVGALSQVCCVSPLGNWFLAAALLVDVNRPDPRKS